MHKLPIEKLRVLAAPKLGKKQVASSELQVVFQ
jgi:hypothetical protein